MEVDVADAIGQELMGVLERAPGFRTASQRAEGLSRADQAASPHTRIAQFKRLAERLLASV